MKNIVLILSLVTNSAVLAVPYNQTSVENHQETPTANNLQISISIHNRADLQLSLTQLPGVIEKVYAQEVTDECKAEIVVEFEKTLIDFMNNSSVEKSISTIITVANIVLRIIQGYKELIVLPSEKIMTFAQITSEIEQLHIFTQLYQDLNSDTGLQLISLIDRAVNQKVFNTCLFKAFFVLLQELENTLQAAESHKQ